MSIYLDHNATTPPAPEVLDAIAVALRTLPGNPSSMHAAGRAARAAIEAARRDVAALVGARAEEIVFTAGGTEGNNLGDARTASARARRDGGRPHVVSSPLEHPSVLGALAARPTVRPDAAAGRGPRETSIPRRCARRCAPTRCW